MNQSQPGRRGESPSLTDSSLLATPLDFISRNHVNDRQMCAVIDRLGTSALLDRQAAQSVLRFLDEEMDRHLRDEVEDLFPLLAGRCLDEDEIECTITRIRVEIEEAARLAPEVRTTVARRLDAAEALSVEEGALLMRFAGHLRRHLVAGHAILLPIARARLTQTDLKTLSQRMRTRRGLPPVSEVSDAQ